MEDEDMDMIDFDENDDELIEVCPICASKDLYYEAGGIEGLYHCKKCGYIGAFVIDANEKMIELIRDEYERNLRISE